MNGRIDAERILDAFLAPEADRLADRVIDAALADIARTPQRHALRVPWRFPLMTNQMRAAAAIAIIAVVGVSVLALNIRSPGPGTHPTAIPTTGPTPTRTPGPPPTPFPAPSAVGIPAWTGYTSAAYGLTYAYPATWRVYAPAQRRWQSGDSGSDVYKDVFTTPTDVADDIGLWVWQRPAGTGTDITTREGLAAWAATNECDNAIEACETVPDLAQPMCAGKAACLPAIVVPLTDGTIAFIGDPATRLVTIVVIGRPDADPSTVPYGGAIKLLKAILTTMDVWTPQPGQIPSPS